MEISGIGSKSLGAESFFCRIDDARSAQMAYGYKNG